MSEISLDHLGLSSYLLNKFAEKDIHYVADLFYFFPLRYEDRRQPIPINEALEKSKEKKEAEKNESACFLKLTCVGQSSFIFKSKSLPVFYFSDGQYETELVAFNPHHRFFKPDEDYLLAGKIKKASNRFKIYLTLSEWEKASTNNSLNFYKWVPIYSLTQGLSQKQIRETIVTAFSAFKDKSLVYNLPLFFVKKYRLQEKLINLQNMHFPRTLQTMMNAKNELVYEEFYSLQEELSKKKLKEKIGKKPNRYVRQELWNELEKRLPFDLTGDQKKCLLEIKTDLNAPAVMRRMVQGEVGSGKTILALFSLLLASENDYQGVLLAPTEVLARQHFSFLSTMLTPLGIKTGLLMGSSPTVSENPLLEKHDGSLREVETISIREKIRTGELKVIVGTHSLFQKEVKYFNLKLVIIDEQHRFGVEQRMAMVAKGDIVDCLMLSATPIPRSLSLTAFGDLDISTLKELPKKVAGRKSRCLSSEDRSYAYKFLRQRVIRGEQGYVVFPLIEEGKIKGSKRSLLKEYQKIKKNVLSAIPIGILHGKMAEVEKQETMQLFLRGKIKILFATTVLEVGLDVKDATVMIVESAEHFGFSQLHQLRGRVGRGEKPGYCYLIHSETVPLESKKRLEKFTSCNDGFILSQMDLEIRGPGEFLGVRQSGTAKFRIGHLVKDYEILKKARDDALEELKRKFSK